MTAGTVPRAADRSDFPYVLSSGTKVGAATAVAVVLYLVVSRSVPAGFAQALLQTVVVLGAGLAASLLPGHFTAARTVQGVAGAAAVGLWGTVIFMAIDIVVLRPVRAYPWTWDAVGGGSSWWYLPIWWMLGTFVAWMGAWFRASRETRGKPTSLSSLAVPVLAGTIGMTVGLQLVQLGIYLPVAAGASFPIILTALAIIANARKG